MRRAKRIGTVAGAALIMAVCALAPNHADAALLETFDGNDCAGEFGQPFADCAIPSDIDENESPIVAKFDFPDNGSEIESEINTGLFPSVSGNEFTLNLTGQGVGTWSYAPDDPGDPAINFFVAKGGNFFNLFSVDGDTTDVDFATPINEMNEQNFGLSHLSFYDTARETPVPTPASLGLLGIGLIALGFGGRRRRAA